MTKVVFIVNGDYQSAMGYRARAISERLQSRYEIELAYRTGNRVVAGFGFLRWLWRAKPRVTYVFDMGYSGVLAAYLYRRLGKNSLIIETGDVIYELMRSTGNRGWVGLRLTRWLEDFSLRIADRIVVRGRNHQRWLAERGLSAEVVQDGVDTEQFKPLNVDDLRQKHGLNGDLSVGVVGASVWSEKLGVCYGWEVIEMLRLLPDAKVKGVIIGSGSGIAHLKARSREYGVEDRVLFLGRLPYEELPRYLNMIDICLSTQTNDLVGQVRTSGKLPLYLATGRFVLASEVGEAAFVLPPEMLVPYDGVLDRAYPGKLAERVREILHKRELPSMSSRNVTVARELFDYSNLAERVGQTIDKVLEQGH